MTPIRKTNRGMTLLEVLAVITIMGFIGIMTVTYFSSAVTQSGEPIVRLQKAFALQSVMENITADYYDMLKESTEIPFTRWEPMTDYSPGVRVSARSVFGHLFVCGEEGGRSGPTEPTWNTTEGAMITDGTVAWRVEKGQLETLALKIRAMQEGGQSVDDIVRDYLYYGRYGVVHAGFICFPVDREEPAIQMTQPGNLLKVMIKNEMGETVTGWFTATY